MRKRPVGVPHPLSWVRRIDNRRWDGETPPAWGYEPASDLSHGALAFELVYCAIERDTTVGQAAKVLGVDRGRALDAVDSLRDSAARRRTGGHKPLGDSAIFKRLARERKRGTRICLAPDCTQEISREKRLGTYACSGKCRKRIHGAGGRKALLAQQTREAIERVQIEKQRRTAVARGQPEASAVVYECATCRSRFDGPTAKVRFDNHQHATRTTSSNAATKES